MAIADRIRKLLELSKSPNAHEAASAAAEAQRLMETHGIEASQIPTERLEPVGESSIKSRETWLASIATSVAKSCFCAAWRGNGDIVICGRRNDVEAAMVLTEWLRLQLESECTKVRKAAPAGVNARHFRNSFLMGAAVEIARRLRERAHVQVQTVSDTGAPSQSGALTVVQTAALARYSTSAASAIEAYKASKGLKFRTSRPSFSANRDAFTAGIDAGGRASMSAPNRSLTGR